MATAKYNQRPWLVFPSFIYPGRSSWYNQRTGEATYDAPAELYAVAEPSKVALHLHIQASQFVKRKYGVGYLDTDGKRTMYWYHKNGVSLSDSEFRERLRTISIQSSVNLRSFCKENDIRSICSLYLTQELRHPVGRYLLTVRLPRTCGVLHALTCRHLLTVIPPRTCWVLDARTCRHGELQVVVVPVVVVAVVVVVPGRCVHDAGQSDWRSESSSAER